MEIDITKSCIDLSFGQDYMDMCSMYDSYKPDPDWVFQDEAGHIHKWINDLVPTLKTVIDERIERCDEDGDTWEEIVSHQECDLCGQHIAPGYVIDVPAGQLVYVPTNRHVSGSYRLNPGEAAPEMDGEIVTFHHHDTTFEARINAIIDGVVHFRT